MDSNISINYGEEGLVTITGDVSSVVLDERQATLVIERLTKFLYQKVNNGHQSTDTKPLVNCDYDGFGVKAQLRHGAHVW